VKPDRRSLLAILWPALAPRFVTTPVADAPAAPAHAAAPLIRLTAQWQLPDVPAPVPLVQLPPAYLASEPPEFTWVGETQRHIGTVVHSWLARLAQQPQLPSAETVGQQRDAVLAGLARAGVPASEQPRAAELVLTAVRRTLEDERGRWMLRAGHAQAHSEWELTGVSAGQLRSVKIDRSFVDEEGTRWVIDFKTSTHEGGDLDSFLAQELQRYRSQLEGYAGLTATLGPEPVRAALYFPLIGVFRELT
jgi:hypothetical protein